MSTLLNVTCSFKEFLDRKLLLFFSVFITRLFLWNHVRISSTTFLIVCRRALSSLSLTNKLASSTNKTNFAPRIFNGRSFMYSKNKTGSGTEPCGAPCFISLQEEIYLLWTEFLLSLWSVSKNCFRCAYYDLNHNFVLSLMPLEFSLSSNMSWFMTQKNFPIAFMPLSIDSCIRSRKDMCFLLPSSVGYSCHLIYLQSLQNRIDEFAKILRLFRMLSFSFTDRLPSDVQQLFLFKQSPILLLLFNICLL